MGRHDTDDLDRRIARGFVAAEYSDSVDSVLDYLAHRSRADPTTLDAAEGSDGD